LTRGGKEAKGSTRKRVSKRKQREALDIETQWKKKEYSEAKRKQKEAKGSDGLRDERKKKACSEAKRKQKGSKKEGKRKFRVDE
jgi:hypothetical protein